MYRLVSHSWSPSLLFARLEYFRADFKSLYDEQITTMTYLALGFAHNLGVTRIPHAVLKQIGLGDGPEDVRASKESLKQKMHSAEEQRAFLGCYSLLAA